MSVWCPQTTSTGHLPNIKFTEHKPEPLSTEFLSICCAITGIMLALQIQRGINNTIPLPIFQHQCYYCCFSLSRCKNKTLPKEKPRANQNEDEDEKDRISNFPSSDLFQGGSWFASISTDEHMMELRYQFKGIVKTAHSLYPKDWLETTMKNYPCGTHLIFESVKDEKNALEYKYSAKKC